MGKKNEQTIKNVNKKEARTTGHGSRLGASNLCCHAYLHFAYDQLAFIAIQAFGEIL